MSATSLEGAALLLVDDLDAASIRRRQPLRPAPPASRARLCNHLARRLADARRELCGAADGISNLVIEPQSCHRQFYLCRPHEICLIPRVALSLDCSTSFVRFRFRKSRPSCAKGESSEKEASTGS